MDGSLPLALRQDRCPLALDGRGQRQRGPRGSCSRDPLIILEWEAAPEVRLEFHGAAAYVP